MGQEGPDEVSAAGPAGDSGQAAGADASGDAAQGPATDARPGGLSAAGAPSADGPDSEEWPAGLPDDEMESLALLRDKPGLDSGSRDVVERRARAFSRSTISDCAVIRRLGDSMGFSRNSGASEAEAVSAGVDRLAADFGLARDQRTKFTSRVYGILVYRLEASHSAQAIAAYTHAVCRVYRDVNRIIPVDPISERAINEQLRACDRTTAVREELEDCILRGLLEIVEQTA